MSCRYLASFVTTAFMTLASAAVLHAGPILMCTSAPCTNSIAPAVTVPTRQDIGTGPTSASNSDPSPIIDGTQALASFGSLGVLDNEVELSTEAQWLDQFTVIGSTGPGMLIVDWGLDGTLSLDGIGTPCTFPFASIGYSGLGALSSFQTSASIDRCAGDGGPSDTVQQSGSIAVPFTYGVPFSVGFTLAADANLGNVSFLNTGDVTSIILPTGASLETLSDASYPVAAGVVPEPATLTLTGFGLAGIMARHRRRRGRGL